MTHNSTNENFPLVTHDESSITSVDSQLPVPADDQWGVDTVTVWFRVNEDGTDAGSEFWKKSSTDVFADSGNTTLRHVGWLHVGSCKVRVSLRLRESTCALSFNAARVVSEKSAYLLPPNALATVIEKLLDELQEVVMPSFDTLNPETGEIVRDPNWKALVNVSRIDVARNLRIPFQKAWLKKAIELQVPSYGRHTIIHRSAQGGWTVQNATQTDGEDRIYDKNAELRRHVIEDSIDMAEGLFRFESQLMK